MDGAYCCDSVRALSRYCTYRRLHAPNRLLYYACYVESQTTECRSAAGEHQPICRLHRSGAGAADGRIGIPAITLPCSRLLASWLHGGGDTLRSLSSGNRLLGMMGMTRIVLDRISLAFP